MSRWITVLGRGGTVLIAISLALLLVSIIPQPQLSRSTGSGSLSSEQIQVAFQAQTLTPQQEIQISVKVEGSLNVYLLEMDNDLQFSPENFNMSQIQERAEIQKNLAKEIIEEQSDKIIWQKAVEDGSYKWSYVPPRVINATVVFSNAGSETAHIEYEITLESSLAPGSKVQIIAYWAAPIGIIFAIPWLLNLRKQKTPD